MIPLGYIANVQSVFLAGKVTHQSLAKANQVGVIHETFTLDVYAMQFPASQCQGNLGRIDGIGLQYPFLACRRYVSSMDNNALYSLLYKCIMDGETAEARFVGGLEMSAGVFLVQSVKELCCV